MTAVAVCEACANEDDELVAVWPASAIDSEQPELWCSDCRERLANEPAADEGDEAD